MNPQYKVGKTKGRLLYFFQTRGKNLELILFMAIFGIFSTVMLGKYMEVKTAVAVASEQVFLGNLRSALLLFAAEKVVDTGRRTFPDPQSSILDRLLKLGHVNWSYKPLDEATGRIEYDPGNEIQGIWYYTISPTFPDSTEFVLVRGMTGLHPFKSESDK
ncbi:MAG: hypothetical protein HQ510_05685 [Candidatus Marinimicrobia bacterium]|nr:hypothetical protein [Candidatus Neomarinimicrobiota bacterium]